MINVAILLVFAILVGDGDPIVAVPRKDMPRLFNAKTMYGELIVDVASPIVYLAKGKPVKISGFVGTNLTRDGKPVKEVDQFYDWQPKLVALKLVASDTVVFENHEKYTDTVFSKEGQNIVALTLGEQRVEVPVIVKSVNFEVGQESADVIKELGLADDVEKIFVEWPINKFVEGVFYSVSVTERIRSIEQWRFKSLPHCVFSVQDRKIVAIDSVCINPFDEFHFPLASDRRHAEEINRRFDQLNLAAVAEMPQLSSAEEFTKKDGTKFRATWIEFKNGKHQMNDEKGVSVEYTNADLSSKTLNRFKEIRKKLEAEKSKARK
jgi:hypothetical protein